MSTEENKAIVHRLFEAFNGENLPEILDEVCVPDFVLHDPNIILPVRSREDYKQFLSAFRTALPGQFTIEFLIAEGDKVAVRYTYHGTHQGPWRGQPPTGNPVTFTGTNTYRIVDGRAVEAWQNADHLSIRQQLGLIPAPGQVG